VPGIGQGNGWLATGFQRDGNLDHCVSGCGFGSIAWLLQNLDGTLPPGVDGTAPGVGVFTWGGIGVVEYQSMVNITGEAWLRSPSTVLVGSNPVVPDGVTIVGVSPNPNPTPGPIPPNPSPIPTPPVPVPVNVKQIVDQAFANLEAHFQGNPLVLRVLTLANQYVDAYLTSHGFSRRSTLLAGRIPPEVITIIDGAFDAAAKAYPQFAPILTMVRTMLDAYLPRL
jgi:hypothetical protein